MRQLASGRRRTAAPSRAAGIVLTVLLANGGAFAQKVTLDELRNAPEGQIESDRIIQSLPELEDEAARRAYAIERQNEFLLLAETASGIGQTAVELRNLRAVADETQGDSGLRRKALRLLGERYLDRGDVTLGLAAVEDALAGPVPHAEAEEIRFVKAALLTRGGRRDEAIAEYSAIAQAASNDDVRCRAWGRQARVMAEAGDLAGAIAKIDAGLALNQIDEAPETRLMLHSGKISAYRKARQPDAMDAALQQLRAEFMERENDYRTEIYLCNILKSTNLRHVALARMDGAIRANADAETAGRDLFVLGREYRKDGSTDRIIDLYSYYIQTFPGNTFFTTKAYQYMIDALLEEKRLVLAADTMKSVADFVNGTLDYRAQLNLAREFYEMGEKPIALATFAAGWANATERLAAISSEPASCVELLAEMARYAAGVEEYDHLDEAVGLASQVAVTDETAEWHIHIRYYEALGLIQRGDYQEGALRLGDARSEFAGHYAVGKLDSLHRALPERFRD